METKFLIYLDILGFNELATKISTEKGLDSKKIRLDFIYSIDSRIKTLESKKKITGKKYGNSDDWILVADDLISTFQSNRWSGFLGQGTGIYKWEVALG